MSEFATLASPYSMPAALHGDVDLTDSEAQTRSRALNQFLAGVELKAFKIAQAALRHEDDALDAVQDAMLQLARAYANRSAMSVRRYCEPVACDVGTRAFLYDLDASVTRLRRRGDLTRT